jgi:predicted regulator of Ras-like GTPase activity (Roadblock/LC7/MglB family)
MFRNLIKDIWDTTPGLQNLLLTGIDGIVIEKHHENDADEFLAAEAANLIKESQRFGSELGSGSLMFMSSHYQDLVIAIQMITQEYFLLGLLEDPRHLGLVRYRFNLKAYEWYSAIV